MVNSLFVRECDKEKIVLSVWEGSRPLSSSWIACSFIKRTANEVMWDKQISATSEEMMKEVLVRLSKDDPVKESEKSAQIKLAVCR